MGTIDPEELCVQGGLHRGGNAPPTEHIAQQFCHVNMQ